MNAKARTLRWWALLIPLLTLIFAIRIWDLMDVPPGITHDEASNGHDSDAILKGEHHIYFPVGYGHEPLYNYSVAATTALLGQSIFTLRVTTVAWGMLQVIVVVALARRWWGRAAALAVAAAYAASFWSLMLARVGLRAPALPALLAASVLCYDHATHPRRNYARRLVPAPKPLPSTIYYAAAGLFLGASLYTYMASRGMPLLYVVYLAGLAAVDRRRFSAVWRGTVAVVLIALLLSGPLFIYLYRNPGLEQRIGQLGSAISSLRQGRWRPLAENLQDSLPMLWVRGDPQWLYNIAGRPGLEPLLAVYFAIGLIYAVRQWRDDPILLTTIWLIGGLAPAMLVTVDYNLLHAIAAMPAVMLLIGAGFAWVVSAAPGSPLPWRKLRTAIALLSALSLAATLADTARAYFVTWRENRNVRVAYHSHVVSLGRYLDATDTDSAAVITTLYPGEFHDPYVMEVTLRRHDLDLRWSDGRAALFFPTTTSRLFIEEQTQPGEMMSRLIAPDLEPSTTLHFRDVDIPSKIDGYVWDSARSWGRLMNQVESTYDIAVGDPPPATDRSKITGPVSFGAIATLAGYLWAGSSAVDDKAVVLLTAWEVNAPTEMELVIFTHLLSAAGDVIAQVDRLDAPSWQWQPGDRFVQLHKLTVPADGLGSEYNVALGLYDRATGDRLPVGPEPAATLPTPTRVLIPLEVSDR